MQNRVEWIKIPAGEHNSTACMSLLGARTEKDLATFGRWCLLRSLIAATETGRIDLSDPGVLHSLSLNLSFTVEEFLELLSRLIELGFLTKEGNEVFNIDVENSIKDYASFVEKQRENGKKGGRPKLTKTHDGLTKTHDNEKPPTDIYF